MPLGAFLLRRSTSSKSVASVDKSTPESSANTNSTRGRKEKRRSRSRTRNRSRSKSRNSSRSKSRNRGSSVDSRSSARSSASGHTLRSKSPSRARIEQFMDEIRAHEEAVARRRSSSAKAPAVSPKSNGSSSKSPGVASANPQSPSSSRGKLKLSTLHRRRPNSSADSVSISRERMRSKSRDRRQQLHRTLSSSSRHSPPEKRQPQPDSTEKAKKSPRGRATILDRDRTRDRSRSISSERLSLFLASRNFESSAGLSISDGGGLTVISMDDDSSSSEESSIGSTSIFEQQPMKSPASSLPTRSISRGTPRGASMRKIDSDLQSPAFNERCKESPNEWHEAIQNRDWVGIEMLLNTYDHKRYHVDVTDSPSNKGRKKLRVLKYLPKGSKHNGESDDDEEEEDISPLLCVDAKNCTPLHLACKEFMPARLLQKLLFLERDAASIPDVDGRRALHIATIGNLSKPVLDKLIRADPLVLTYPDSMKKTPLAYAILRAEHARDKKVNYTWSCPTSAEHASWQSRQGENWATVKFLLETMVSRGQSLSEKHETALLLQAVDCYAPPSVLATLSGQSAKIIEQNKKLLLQLLQKLARLHYPISTFQYVLRLCSSCSVPQENIVGVFRVGLIAHYNDGTISKEREDLGGRKKSFRSEILAAYQKGRETTEACQEWWDKLRFFVAVGSSNLQDPQNLSDEYVLHAALTIPEAPATLVECLIRMFPQARYSRDPTTEALPLHLACRYWGETRLWMTRKGGKHQEDACKVLNLLLAGDFTLAWKRYRRRIPLHYAILSGKPVKFIQTLVSIDVKTANSKDIRSDLFPFQLAALPRGSDVTKDAGLARVETIFELLRINPIAVCPKMALGSGDPKGDVGAVARHVVNWCYSYKRGESDTGWITDEKHVQVLRSAISKGAMPSSLKRWWGDLKRKIWNVYDRQNAGKTISYMPRLDKFLLHAALYNGRTPPIVIELLLELYPDAVYTRAPGTDRYPLHIAAASPSYTPLPFESVISMSSALEMILLSYPDALYETSEGRTVLQIAVDSGKTHEEIRPLFQQHPEMLTVPDTSTELYPFQQIASIESSLPTHLLIRDKTSTVKWNERSTPENARLLRGIQVSYQRDKLSSIYEMLRAKPQVVEMCFAA